MSLHQSSRQLARAARSLRHSEQSKPLTDFYKSFSKLCLYHVRSYHVSSSHLSLLDLTTKSSVKKVKELKEQTTTTVQRRQATAERMKPSSNPIPEERTLTSEQRQELIRRRVRDKQKEDEKKAIAQSQKLGGLAPNSFFADQEDRNSETTPQTSPNTQGELEVEDQSDSPFTARNLSNMAVALNPRPNARARWQRRMVIRDIRHRGRITRTMRIARTERSHLSRSHFFKTSMKKLAPLARQIAGKSIDEAITQMRFSKKKAAIDVKQHLIAARNEAIVARGMGLPPTNMQQTASRASEDPSITPPLPTQKPGGSLHNKHDANPTDIYIAEAWTNRGPYGQEAEYRAKGRANILRPPYTGLSVLLKEEKTRTREKDEKEANAIRKRMGKNMWTQLPDRPVIRQSQQVLW